MDTPMPIRQTYFELRDVRPLQGRPWIPLRQATNVSFDPPAEAGITRIEEFIGIATAAVDEAKRAEAEKLGWDDLHINPHRSAVESWGYRAADIFRSRTEPLGINLVIHQYLEEEGRHIWHLHPDLIVALGLLLERDSWYRPKEGWVEVARLKRDKDDKSVLLEIQAEFLADYLAARGMALYCSSYLERVGVASTKPAYSWSDNGLKEEARAV